MQNRLIGTMVVISAAALATIAGCSCNPVGPTYKNQTKLTWTVDTISNPGSFQTALSAVWGSSPGNVYVAGFSSSVEGEVYRYNGKVWTKIPFTALEGGPIQGSVEISDMCGFNANDVWVVGQRIDSLNQVTHIPYNSSVIANWNGTTWREYPAGGDGLAWISGLAPNDIWASGGGVVYHYNGSAWQKSTIPIPPQGMAFETIAEVAPNDVYTIGTINDVTPPADTGSYFLYHFDGSSWSIVDSVIATSTYVSPITFGEKLFAVGGHLYTSWGEGIQEFTGSGWTTISNDTRILFLGGNSPDNLFGVGSYGAVDWYNGSTWQEINVGASTSIAMYSVWTDGSQTFIVGNDNSGYKTYIYHGH